MFTWICPKCGQEVPPSAAECPYCAGQHAKPEEPPLLTTAPTPPAAPAVQEPAVRLEKRKPALPLWLMSMLFAAAFAVVGIASALLYRHFQNAEEAAKKGAAYGATPAVTLSATPTDSALARAVEVTGIRLVETKDKKTEVIFIVVNHSPAPLPDLSATVTLRPSTATPGQEVVGIFGFKNLSLGPYESRELRAPLNTSLRPYELPDWQFLKTDLVLSSGEKKP